MKKGRHRRFEEARALKRINENEEPPEPEPCVECGSEPGDEHASWCLAAEESVDDEFVDGAGVPILTAMSDERRAMNTEEEELQA